MVQSMQNLVPAEWSGTVEVLSAPIAWVPAWQSAMINFAWFGASGGEVLLKRVLLLLPILLLVAAMWSTMISLYTLPFRSGRGGFVTSLLMSWWDAGRTIWFFWAGLVRVTVVLAGWAWGLLRLGIRMLGAGIKGTFQTPLAFLDWTSRNYFKPGVPWVAFLGLILWSAVEALVFTYTLRPTMTEVLAGITGFEPDPRFMTPILWIFLFFLVLGSFACVYALAEAIRQKRHGEILQMVTVELFVMFFEVLFLYREMIDALTPWIAQQSNEELLLGLWSTLGLAAFGWVGVRGMTWFLFGRYGTPALLAVLARDTIKREAGVAAPVPSAARPDVWHGPIAALKRETEWFKKEARYIFELLSLPILQLFAAGVNFAVVAVTSQPMFSLPFSSLDRVLAATPGFPNRKQAKAGPKGAQQRPAQLQEEAAR
jgi:hypothetical protein